MAATGWKVWKSVTIRSMSVRNKSCTIRCYKGSKMDAYCDEYELKREYIGAESVVNE